MWKISLVFWSVKPWKNAFEINWPVFRWPKVRLKTKLAGSGEPEIVTFDRQSGIIKQYLLQPHNADLTVLFVVVRWLWEKKVLGPFFHTSKQIRIANVWVCLIHCEAFWSKDVNKILNFFIQLWFRREIFNKYILHRYLMLMNFMVWCQRKFLVCKDFLVSFEPKLNVRFYLAVASGTIQNSKKSNALISIDLIWISYSNVTTFLEDCNIWSF